MRREVAFDGTKLPKGIAAGYVTLELVQEQLVKVVVVVTQAAAYVNPQKLVTFGLDWS
jgi:hypothetical protein